MAQVVAELFKDLAECLSDAAKESPDSAQYEGNAEESAILKSMARQVEAMTDENALTYLLEVEPLARREALMRLGIQTGVLVFARAEHKEDGDD